jgi:hypothetical protein
MKTKILLGALLAIVAAVLVFVAVVAMQPADFRITRSATIAAPPAVVFDQVNHLRKWEAWSPWAKLDPNVKNTFEGPPSGEGAKFHWSGNDDVGEGVMTVTESRAPEFLQLNLQFVRPFEDAATVQFDFKPAGEGTEVIWTMLGQNNFMAKAMCLFMDMDAMIGGDFERGLADMKKLAEAAASQPSVESTEPVDSSLNDKSAGTR